MKIAHFSPMPPERTGIADYSALLLPELETRVDVVLARRGRRRPSRGIDLSVYHIGNNPDAHDWILEALRRRPGLVVLHDLVLHHLIAGMTLGKGEGSGYIDAMHRDAGTSGRLVAHGVVDGVVAAPWEVCPERFPLIGEMLPFALGVVVHSGYVERRLRGVGYARPIWRVEHPAWPVPRSVTDGPVAPSETTGGFGVLSFGNLNVTKRVPQLLRAFAALREEVPDARLVLAGSEAPQLGLDGLVAELGLGTAVERHGRVDEATLWSLIGAADVCVSLRHPTMGETSGAVLRALSAGCPQIVSDSGWYAELPGAVAAKIPVDGSEHDVLVATLRLLAERPDVRQAMSREALELAAGPHAVARVADGYVATFERLVGDDALQDEVVGELASAAAGVGMEPGDPDVARMGAYLRELGL